jgi:hypothetical protein
MFLNLYIYISQCFGPGFRTFGHFRSRIFHIYRIIIYFKIISLHSKKDKNIKIHTKFILQNRILSKFQKFFLSFSSLITIVK